MNKSYFVGDIIALAWGTGAISCKVIGKGIAQTKRGRKIFFSNDEVVWVLGKTGRWPKFVQFKGEDSQNVTTRIEGKPETKGICEKEHEG